MKYDNFNVDISLKRLAFPIETDITIACYGFEDFTHRKSLTKIHKMGEHTLQFIEFGEGVLKIEDSIYKLKEHDLFYLPYNVPLKYFHDKRNPYKYYWISIQGKNFEKLLSQTHLAKNPVVNIENWQQMLKLFQAFDPNKNIPPIKMKALFYSILSMIEKDENEKIQPQDPSSLFSQILEFIHFNYSQPTLSVAFIAEQFHIDTMSLYRLFIKNMNCSVKQYIIDYRIEQAKQFLTEGISISKCSNSCGFSNCYYFSRAFKKYTSKTPSQFKQELCHQIKE